MSKKMKFVARPFEGLEREGDWVAMREIVPAASATVRTTAEYGSRDVLIATVLPMAWAALHRDDGQILAALQTVSSSGDASRDIAAAILAAIDAEPGNPVPDVGLPGEGPRLQDILDPAVPLSVEVRDGFDFWISPDAEETPEIKASLERASEAAAPTARLVGVESAYWCSLGDKEFLRWVMPYPEEKLLDALARLHAARESSLGEGSRVVGAFRADGLCVPVWELAPGASAEELEIPAKEFKARFDAALAVTDPLTADQRRARAGLVSRQVTLR